MSSFKESVSESSLRDTRVDEAKTDFNLPPGMDVDEEIKKYEQLSQQTKKETSLIRKLMKFEIEVNFKNTNTLVTMLGVFAAAAGLLSGLDQSIISGASIGMRPALHLTDDQDSLVSSLMPLGAMAGSILMTPLNEYFGRKMSIIISCVWYTIGSALCAGSHTHNLMYAGRFILGVGVGIEGGCVGIYISESVPASVRGNLVSLYQFSIALGEVLGYAVAAMFFEVKGGWRYMVGSSLVFSTILLIGVIFLPESPRYLVYKERTGEAFSVWKRLRDINDIRNKIEFIDMNQTIGQEIQRKKEENTIQVWSELFAIPRNRRALVYAFIMVTLGQITGANAIMYYMSTMMGRIGFDEKRSVFMSLVGGGALMLGSIPAVLWMDRFGRRTWGMNIIFFFFGLVLVGVGYAIPLETHHQAAEGTYLTGLILYMGFFGSYACLTWVCPSESFAVRTRTIGMSICSTALYLWTFVVTYNFNKMQKAMTYTGLTLGFYGGIAFVGFIYQLLFMPETKDKTLEEIDDLFSMSSFDLMKLNIRSLKRFWRIT
ncbi:Piso0_005909 [Millerozyma farinosa CBS 7064]|uniref:Piso0_005909 protein n=1 Tax=Pichia sorbitophila (strain ATCC MYA-4447 / BCRC 22081 / CBS 7064 / NBRC 10061 / NRRL Y-12695) TaxID=559304 RepID=G8Y386_PICSO|nr:Piso0_005909 [Millerozyma farinosa CBS 7064]